MFTPLVLVTVHSIALALPYLHMQSISRPLTLPLSERPTIGLSQPTAAAASSAPARQTTFRSACDFSVWKWAWP